VVVFTGKSGLRWVIDFVAPATGAAKANKHRRVRSRLFILKNRPYEPIDLGRMPNETY